MLGLLTKKYFLATVLIDIDSDSMIRCLKICTVLVVIMVFVVKMLLIKRLVFAYPYCEPDSSMNNRHSRNAKRVISLVHGVTEGSNQKVDRRADVRFRNSISYGFVHPVPANCTTPPPLPQSLMTCSL